MFEGNSQLRGFGEAYEYTPEMIKEVIKCKEDILYFASNYFYIQNLDKGKIKIPLWDFQKKLLKVLLNPPENKRHVVMLSARQMSKTTVSTIYILHEMLFKKDYNIAILANNERTAREILSRIQMAYMLLPLWLQRGVKEWNKSSIILENGVRVLAASTSSNSIRGFSINCVDENGTVDIKYDDNEETITIKELISRLEYFGFKDGKKIYKNENYKVLTDDGYKSFFGVSLAEESTVKLTFESGDVIYSTKEHLFFSEYMEKIEAQNLRGKNVQTKTGFDKCLDVKQDEKRNVCDLLSVEDVNRYFYNNKNVKNCLYVDEASFIFDYIWQDFEASVMPTISSGKTSKIIMVSTPNGLNHFYNIYKKAAMGESDFYAVKIPWHFHPDRDEAWKESMIRNTSKQQFAQEFDCQFLGSSSTLIAPDKLEILFPREPVDIAKYSGALQVYEAPIDGCSYVMGVDPGKGTGGDYSVIQVLKLVNEHEISLVATYRSNYIKIESFADVVVGVSEYYNNCQAMVESNDVGEVLCRDLWNKKNFEGLCNVDKGKLGIRSTRKSKLEGNLLLKQYVDNEWIEIYDKRTIYELSRYVEVSPDVYHAEGQNEHDDCVTALIWALYFIKTDYYDGGYAQKDGSDGDIFQFAVMDGNVVGGGFDNSGFGNSPYDNPYGNGDNVGFNLF